MPRRLAAACLVIAGLTGAPCWAQVTYPAPSAMAVQPDPKDFIGTAGTSLIVQGNPFRFGGLNTPWLGLIEPGGGAPPRAPTEFEVTDVLSTASAMASGYVRAVSLGVTVGCQACLVPSPGHINQAALSHIDQVLKTARDAGEKIVIPLSGDGTCPSGGQAAEQITDAACAFARVRGKGPEAFYSDPAIRADFAAAVKAILDHLNPLTGQKLRADPSIMAWENCDGCGKGIDTQVLADWTEFLGRIIKQEDNFHLYENGAFAGRLSGLPAAMIALPSVDILGDRVMPGQDADGAGVSAASSAVTKAGRPYVIDAYGWTPAQWPTAEDFEGFLKGVAKKRTVAGAFLSNLSGHDGQGGYLPSSPADPALYFPGTPTPSANLAEMQARSRAVRRFSFRMIGMDVPPFSNVSPPAILSAVNGRLSWRGAAGALDYSIARSTDITAGGSWTTLCDRCATDAAPAWQDPSPVKGASWYRITPYNANGHAGLPSKPFQNK